MATTRGKGTSGTRTPADTAGTAGETRARGTRTRAPEDEIGGTAAPEAAVQAPARGRRAAPGAGVADADTPAGAPATQTPASRGRGRSAPGTGVAEASPPAASPAPSPAPKKSGGRKKRETYTETAARRRREKEVDQLQADLRAFAIARPSGWNHDDWMAFLAHLSERGHDVSDQAVIGSRLEQERLGVALAGIEGLGPKRVEALVQRFQTLWSMRHADAASIAGVPGMTRPLAERVAQQLRERYA